MLVKLTTGVSFINTFRADFVKIFLLQKITNLYCKQIKAQQNSYVQKNSLYNVGEIGYRR